MKDKFGGFAETCMEGACQVARLRRKKVLINMFHKIRPLLTMLIEKQSGSYSKYCH